MTKKLVFSRAFDFDFGFTPMEIKSTTLDQIQPNALEGEGNLAITGKLKTKAKHIDIRKEKKLVL